MYNKKNYFFVIVFILFFSVLLNAQKYYSHNKNWNVEIKYILPGTVNLYSETSDTSKVIGYYYYLDKVLIINDKNNYVKFGWAKVIYPNEGYLHDMDLITTEQKIELDERFKNKPDELQSTQNWQPYIIECDKEYSFIKNGDSFTSDNKGIVKQDDEVLVVSDNGLLNKEWLQILYPKAGYVFAEEYAVIPSNHILGIGVSYGALNIPYEKNLKNHRNPIGGFIEYTKSNWDFLFRIGYSNSQSNLKEYILKNDIIYLNIQYSFLRLFNNHFRFYALAGGGYWFSKFQYTKYPSLTDYFPEEKNKGFGYIVGGGIEYNLYGFFLGVQYSYFGTKEVTFGPVPKPGEFTNQYKLFIGSNQVEVDLGYRFEL